MFKIRFNLGKGPNYKKWKITNPDKSIDYYKPEDVLLCMMNCTLYNNKKESKKIYEGANKRVCAWISCENLTIVNNILDDYEIQNKCLSYNPRIKPNWVYDNKDVDGKDFNFLFTFKNKIEVIAM